MFVAHFKTFGMQNGCMFIFFLRSFRKVKFLEDGFLHTRQKLPHFLPGFKIASHPGVLTQAKCAKKITQNLEINQIWGVVVQEKESNMVFFSRWKFPTLGMTVLSGTSAEPRFRSVRSSLGLETSI